MRRFEEFLGLSRNGSKPKPDRKLLRTIRYEIRDLEGELKATHIRHEYDDGDKNMPWEPSGIKAAELPLFQIEKTADSADGDTVVVCEGEKAAVSLWERRVLAIGTVTGASRIPCDESLEPLKRFRLLLWPDNDKGGYEHMARIGYRLLAMGHDQAMLKLVLWDAAPNKGDAADFNGDIKALDALLEQARPFGTDLPIRIGTTAVVPASLGLRTPREYLAQLERRNLRPLWGPRLEAGTIAMIVGRGWSGKTTSAMSLAEAFTLGKVFLGEQCTKCKVGYFAIERNGTKVVRMFDQWGLSDSILVETAKDLPLGFEARAQHLYEQIIKHQLEVVFIDHLQILAGIPNMNDAAAVSAALERLNQIAQITGCLMIVLHHQGKTPRFNSDFIDVLGSEAYRAHVDALFECYKAFNSYFMRGQIRDELDLPRVRLSRDDTGHVAESDEQGEVGVDALIVETLEAEPRWLSRQQIVAASPELAAVTARVINRRLKSLSESNEPQIQRHQVSSGKPIHYAAPGVVEPTPPTPKKKRDEPGQRSLI
jgi:hypothetical protein